MLHFGPVALYRNTTFLGEDIAKLESEGFDMRTLDASRWDEVVALHNDLKTTLELPDYYGENLNALSDCMQDLVIPDDGGMAIVIRDYDAFSNRFADYALGFLDVLTRGSRFLQIFGKTLLVIVHTNDANASFERLGATSAVWNSREFVRKNRGDAETSQQDGAGQPPTSPVFE